VGVFWFPAPQANPYDFEQIHLKRLLVDYSPKSGVFPPPLRREALASAFELLLHFFE
jgi:hypothetical protein